MKIVLVAPPSIPVPPEKYGGTQRDVYWLATALADDGHEVTVLAKEGSYINEQVEVIPIPEGIEDREYLDYLPPDFDIVNFHVKIDFEPDFPYLHSLHGNAKPEEYLPPNTSFISRSHAEHHGGRYYVYNGLDLADYEFSPTAEDYFAFLGKISVRHKNVKYAVELAKEMDIKLKIGGGWRPSLRGNIEYLGFVGGEEKIDFLQKARGLIFPTAWAEPMGLVVNEALACGTPVIVSDRGAMPELVPDNVGFVCRTEADYREAIRNIGQIDRRECRQYVKENLTKENMADGYLQLYRKILADPESQLHEEVDLNETKNAGNLVELERDSLLDKIKRMFT